MGPCSSCPCFKRDGYHTIHDREDNIEPGISQRNRDPEDKSPSKAEAVKSKSPTKAEDVDDKEDTSPFKADDVEDMSPTAAEYRCLNKGSKKAPSKGQFLVFSSWGTLHLYVYFKDIVLMYEITKDDGNFRLKDDLNGGTHDSISALIQYHQKHAIQLKNNKQVKLTKVAKAQ